MNIQALIAGKLVAYPEGRTGASGKPFCLVRPVAHNGEVVALIAFGSVAEQLAVMTESDTIAVVAGRTKSSTWTTRDIDARTGLSLTVDALLTPSRMKPKCATVNGDPRPAQAPRQANSRGDDFDHGESGLDGGAP